MQPTKHIIKHDPVHMPRKDNPAMAVVVVVVASVHPNNVPMPIVAFTVHRPRRMAFCRQVLLPPKRVVVQRTMIMYNPNRPIWTVVVLLRIKQHKVRRHKRNKQQQRVVPHRIGWRYDPQREQQTDMSVQVQRSNRQIKKKREGSQVSGTPCLLVHCI